MGILPYYYYEKFWAAEPRYESVELVDVQDGEKNIRHFRTPVGELREESVYSPLSCSWASRSISSNPKRSGRAAVRSGASPLGAGQSGGLARAAAAVAGIRRTAVPLDCRDLRWPRHGGVGGVQNASYLWLDCPQKGRGYPSAHGAAGGADYRRRMRFGAAAGPFSDNLSSDCTTGFYDDHMAGTHRRRIERLHAAGVKCAVHLDGTVKGLLPKLVRSGFDAIEALTPKPAGDLDIEEIRKLAASDTVILWGGVPGVMFAPPTPGSRCIARAAACGLLAGPAFHRRRGRPGAA